MNILNKHFNKIYIISSYSTQNRLINLIPFFAKENIDLEIVIGPKKKYFNPDDRYQAIRVAGKFTTKHLGGLRESIVPLDEINFYKSTSRYSYFSGKLNSDNEPSFDITVLEFTKLTELIESLKENVQHLDSKVQEQNRMIQSIA